MLSMFFEKVNQAGLYFDAVMSSQAIIFIAAFAGSLAVMLAFLYFLAGPSSGIRSKQQRNIQKSCAVIDRLGEMVVQDRYKEAFHFLRFQVDPYVFEETILTAFENKGAVVIRSPSYSGDGGVDGEVIFHGETWLIQAKRYKNHIAKSHVENHVKLCSKRKKKGLFVHTGRTGAGAFSATMEGVGIRMLSGRSMIDFLAGHKTIDSILR